MQKQVAIIGKGMIGISLAVLFTGNGIPTIVFAKKPEIGLEKYRTYYWDLRVLLPLGDGTYEVRTPMEYAALTILGVIGDV